DGVFMVSLALIADPRLVVPTIAQALGVQEAPDQALHTALTYHLFDRHILLLLDNFEQVLPAAVEIVQIVAECPFLQVIVTSRELLNVRGEYELAVPPLDLPDLKNLPALLELREYAAVRLFGERAAAA